MTNYSGSMMGSRPASTQDAEDYMTRMRQKDMAPTEEMRRMMGAKGPPAGMMGAGDAKPKR